MSATSSASSLAEISVRSPQFFLFTLSRNIFSGLNYPKNNLFKFENRSTGHVMPKIIYFYINIHMNIHINIHTNIQMNLHMNINRIRVSTGSKYQQDPHEYPHPYPQDQSIPKILKLNMKTKSLVYLQSWKMLFWTVYMMFTWGRFVYMEKLKVRKHRMRNEDVTSH